MRISVLENNKDYIADYCNYEVTLDGNKLIDCVMVDEEKGEYERYKTDDKGIKTKKGLFGVRFETELLKGNVKLTRVDH